MSGVTGWGYSWSRLADPYLTTTHDSGPAPTRGEAPAPEPLFKVGDTVALDAVALGIITEVDEDARTITVDWPSEPPGRTWRIVIASVLLFWALLYLLGGGA